MSRGDRDRLDDIIERIEALKDAELVLTEAESQGERRLAQTAFDAILSDLVVIGEAVGRLSKGLRGREPTVPWDDIIGMRNVIAHEYFRIHSEVVSATIDAPLRDLEVACRRLRSRDSEG